MNAPMPEDGRGALEQHIVDRLDLILRLMLGNGEVGILEQVRQNKREIERLRNSVDMVLRDPESEDPSVTKARLRLIGEIVVAISAISAVVLHFLGG